MRANQLRLWPASFAYVLMCAVRRIGLTGTPLAAATCGTIRLKLLKIGAIVTISVRRVKLAFASTRPDRETFALAARLLEPIRLALPSKPTTSTTQDHRRARSRYQTAGAARA